MAYGMGEETQAFRQEFWIHLVILVLAHLQGCSCFSSQLRGCSNTWGRGSWSPSGEHWGHFLALGPLLAHKRVPGATAPPEPSGPSSAPTT